MNSSGTGWISGEQSKRDQARGKWAFSHLFDLFLSSSLQSCKSVFTHLEYRFQFIFQRS